MEYIVLCPVEEWITTLIFWACIIFFGAVIAGLSYRFRKKLTYYSARLFIIYSKSWLSEPTPTYFLVTCGCFWFLTIYAAFLTPSVFAQLELAKPYYDWGFLEQMGYWFGYLYYLQIALAVYVALSFFIDRIEFLVMQTIMRFD